jgi:tetratricopeptide (TPR) repeat protein
VDAVKHAQEAVQLQATAANLATLARAQARAQMGAEAVATAARAVQAGAGSAAAHAARAEALIAAGRASEAEAAARKALELDPKFTPGRVQLASALIEEGKAAEAEAEARKAVEDPRSAEAYAVLGSAIIAVDPKAFGKAIAEAQQGAFLNPRSPVVQVAVGRIFEAGGNPDQAAAAYRKALEADTSNVSAALALATALIRSGKTDEALASVRALVQAHPQSAEANLQLGRLLLRKGDWGGAADALAKAAAGLPKSAEAHARLGTAYQFTGRTADALAAYRKAVELDPKNLEYRTTYGIVLGTNKQFDAGIAELKRVIESPGYKSPDAYLNLGWLYRNTEPKRADESVAAYRKALELDPTNEQAALGMGWSYMYLKNYDEAIKAFDKTVQLAPELADDAYNAIGWAYLFKKDVPQAEAFLAKAKSAGRSDARLADNIERFKKNQEIAANVPDQPAPAPRPVMSDPGTLSQILLGGSGAGAKCKAARDLVKAGSDGVSALIGALRDRDIDVRICAASALGRIGSAASSARPHLIAAASACKSAVAIPTAEDLKNDAKCNELGNAVREAVGRF